MSLVTPDFSEVAEEIAPGTYRGQIRKIEEGQWQSGTKHLKVEIETVGESDPKNNGRRVFDRLPISGGGAFRLQKFYKAATGEALKGPFNTEQLLGRQVVMTIIDGTDKEGKKTGYIEVKNYAPVV